MITAKTIARLAAALNDAEAATRRACAALAIPTTPEGFHARRSPAESEALAAAWRAAQRAESDARGAYLAALAQSHADRVL
jgi:hypothetical protein